MSRIRRAIPGDAWIGTPSVLADVDAAVRRTWARIAPVGLVEVPTNLRHRLRRVRAARVDTLAWVLEMFPVLQQRAGSMSGG